MTPYLTKQEVLDVDAQYQFGPLDMALVKKSMGPNWPEEWEHLLPMTKPEAKLLIQVGEERRPSHVVVMVGHNILATVSLRELRRVVVQLDHLEVGWEHGVTEEEE